MLRRLHLKHQTVRVTRSCPPGATSRYSNCRQRPLPPTDTEDHVAVSPPTVCTSGKRRGETVRRPRRNRHCSAGACSEAVASALWWQAACRQLGAGRRAGPGRSLQATGHQAESRSCGAAKPKRCAEPQPLSGTCPPQGRAEAGAGHAPPPPQAPSVVLAPPALQRGGSPGSHAGETLRWPGRSEGAMGLEWGVGGMRGGVREEPSTAAGSPPGQHLGWWPPRDAGLVAEAQSSAWRASEITTEGTLANA